MMRRRWWMWIGPIAVTIIAIIAMARGLDLHGNDLDRRAWAERALSWPELTGTVTEVDAFEYGGFPGGTVRTATIEFPDSSEPDGTFVLKKNVRDLPSGRASAGDSVDFLFDPDSSTTRTVAWATAVAAEEPTSLAVRLIPAGVLTLVAVLWGWAIVRFVPKRTS